MSNCSSNISIFELIFNKSLYLDSIVPYINTCRTFLFEKLVVALLVKYVSFDHKEELLLLFSFPTDARLTASCPFNTECLISCTRLLLAFNEKLARRKDINLKPVDLHQ